MASNIWIAERPGGFHSRVWTDDVEMRDRLRQNGYTITEVVPVGERQEPQLPPAPAKFLFDFDDPFEEGDVYVWIVAEPFFRETGYVDDSSSAQSVLSPQTRMKLRGQTTDDGQDKEEALVDEAHFYLAQATHGILYGEGMESCWEADIKDDETRDDAIARIKAALEKRGFVHEPKIGQS